MSTSRDQIIQTTCTLLEAQGYHATGLNQVVKESGAPKGSLYYYFPEGKEAIAAEAIRHVTGIVVERISSSLAEIADPAEAVQSLALTIAHHIEASGFQSGGPLTTTALETATTNERLNQVCHESYERMRQVFEERLLTSHFLPEEAVDLSFMILAAMEGGIVLSRTYHSGDPLRRVGAFLYTLIKATK